MISCFTRTIICVSIALSFSPCLLAESTDTEVEILRQQMKQIQQQNEAQNLIIQAMAKRLQQVEAAAMEPAAAENNERPNTIKKADEPIVKDAPIARSAKALLQERHFLFNQQFSLEAGITYIHSDRRDLFLNGFLALDAIFLGNISLDKIKADTLTFNATGR